MIEMFFLFNIYSYLFYGFVMALTAMIALYRYLMRDYSYWSSHGIDGPKPYPLFGTSIYEFIGMRCHYERQWLQTYGNVYGKYQCNTPVLTVLDPMLIKDILVKDFHLFIDKNVDRTNDVTNQSLFLCGGDQWKRLRPLMTQLFTLSKSRRMYRKMSECVNRLSNEIQLHVMSEEDIDIKHLAGKYVSNVLCECLLGLTVEEYKSFDAFVLNGQHVFDYKPLYELSMTLLPLSLMKFLAKNIKFDANVGNEFFIDIGRQVMANVKHMDNNSHNMIHMLLNERRTANECNSRFNVTQNDERITDDEILGNVWQFFVANYAMTANVLSAIMHTLAVNDDIQRQLCHELVNTFNTCDDMDYTLLDSLPYLDAIISEALRLYTPPIRLTRIAKHDYSLGHTGLTIAKGMRVEIPIYALHMNEQYFPNSDVFIPDRFMPENKSKIIPFTYLPFGGGPRTCVGSKFAAMQIKVFLAKIIMKYHFHSVSATHIPMKLFKHTGFVGPLDVILGAKQRTSVFS